MLKKAVSALEHYFDEVQEASTPAQAFVTNQMR